MSKKLIKCTECNAIKNSSLYKSTQLLSDSPKCKVCEGNYGKYHTRGIPIEVKIKKCLNCDTTFNSLNGSRYCDSCKKQWV
jgi:hypothetical protein